MNSDTGHHKYAIIVAAGRGTRLETALPKQFMYLGQLPVFMYSFIAFRSFVNTENICIVIPEGYRSLIEELRIPFPDLRHCRITNGGAMRFDSVKAGLECLPEKGYVAVHDAARPLINESLIGEGYRLITQYPAVVPAIPVKESVRRLSANSNQWIDRSSLRLIQTPQWFRLESLRKAYKSVNTSAFTDDASVMEAKGFSIHLFEGQETNIKITTREDFIIAAALLGISDPPVFPVIGMY